MHPDVLPAYVRSSICRAVGLTKLIQGHENMQIVILYKQYPPESQEISVLVEGAYKIQALTITKMLLKISKMNFFFNVSLAFRKVREFSKDIKMPLIFGLEIEFSCLIREQCHSNNSEVLQTQPSFERTLIFINVHFRLGPTRNP